MPAPQPLQRCRQPGRARGARLSAAGFAGPVGLGHRLPRRPRSMTSKCKAPSSGHVQKVSHRVGHFISAVSHAPPSRVRWRRGCTRSNCPLPSSPSRRSWAGLLDIYNSLCSADLNRLVLKLNYTNDREFYSGSLYLFYIQFFTRSETRLASRSYWGYTGLTSQLSALSGRLD